VGGFCDGFGRQCGGILLIPLSIFITELLQKEYIYIDRWVVGATHGPDVISEQDVRFQEARQFPLSRSWNYSAVVSRE
jgi:hypothetical protein